MLSGCAVALLLKKTAADRKEGFHLIAASAGNPFGDPVAGFQFPADIHIGGDVDSAFPAGGKEIFQPVKHLHVECQGVGSVFLHQPVVVMMNPDGIVAETRQTLRQFIAFRMRQKLRFVAEIDPDKADPFFRGFFKGNAKQLSPEYEV